MAEDEPLRLIDLVNVYTSIFDSLIIHGRNMLPTVQTVLLLVELG